MSAPPRFETLLASILPDAYRSARYLTRDPHDAEDLVQEAALLAFRGFSGFQTGTNFRAWFLRILTNAFFCRCRKTRRSGPTVPLELVPEASLTPRAPAAARGGSDDPAAEVLGRLQVDQVVAAIEALPLDFRAVASFYFVHELSYQEMAEILGVPVGTVRSRLHRGRRMLQQELWGMAEEAGIVRNRAAVQVSSRD